MDINVKTRLRIWVLALSCLLTFNAPGHAAEDALLYSKAVQAARAGHADFAFMHYNALLRDYPHSKFREQALFAVGEYYFRLPYYSKTVAALNDLVKDYPASTGKLFALAYLYRIAEEEKNQEKLDELKKQIITFERVGFVFKEFKEYRYQSPLDRNHQAVFHIDKVEFFVGGDRFAQISF